MNLLLNTDRFRQIHNLNFIFPHPFLVDRSHYLTSSRLSDNTSDQQILHRSHGPLARYEKIAGAHAPGMPGTFSPPSGTSDLDMHHGTCVTHVPWCMPGSLTSVFPWCQWRGKTFPAFPAHAQPAILRIWQEAHWIGFYPLSWNLMILTDARWHAKVFPMNILYDECYEHGCLTTQRWMLWAWLSYKQWKIPMYDETRCYNQPTGLFRNIQLIGIRPRVSRYIISNEKHTWVNTRIWKCKRLCHTNSQAITYSGICQGNLLTPISVRQVWCDLLHSVWIWHMTRKYHLSMFCPLCTSACHYYLLHIFFNIWDSVKAKSNLHWFTSLINSWVNIKSRIAGLIALTTLSFCRCEMRWPTKRTIVRWDFPYM